MKDLGPLKYFLRIEILRSIIRSKQGIFLSQCKYTLELLGEVGMLTSKPSGIPSVENVKLGKFSYHILTNQKRCQSLFIQLIYLSHTRLDLTYSFISVT